MSIRLQVVMEEAELRELKAAARRRGMTVSEWVREAIRAMRRQEPTGDRNRKLMTVREASRNAYPSGDIDEMLRDIERGYSSGTPE
jgi:hypothetical protein